MEWQKPDGQWVATYLQRSIIHGDFQGNPTENYFVGSNLNSIFREVTYKDTSVLRGDCKPARIVHVGVDWMKQVIRISERSERPVMPEPAIFPPQRSIIHTEGLR